MIHFGTVSTAMVTPFDRKENIDFGKTTQLIQYLLQNGTDSLVVAGTTGESPTLTKEEKVALFTHVVKVVDGRVPVIAGTGSNNTKQTVELTKEAERTGVDAIMIVTPYYNKPSQLGIRKHVEAVASETTLPVMLYNVPGRTITSMTPETIIELSKLPNVVAVKEASGDLSAMTKIIRETSDDFLVYSGEDALTLPSVAIGATGIISVASHVIGKEMQTMISSAKEGDLASAAVWNGKLLPVMEAMFAAPSPAPVKTALQVKGIDVGTVRLPLLPLDEKERQSLTEVLTPFY
ncbi:4-hydroxy-tetrahydrodipicolinate synthase [Bacillus fonticola]|uniref:4-hydroxy-tetrahydrodipicolinate synthase n=1 Tax=Bacillus fonticola TaxID=2728853 RepID=UPI0014753CCD|nr:4-hydroxy-tetrahydrodipicolinate synthase [Bacillus fonticola]